MRNAIKKIYQCKKCGKKHRYDSKIGQAHITEVLPKKVKKITITEQLIDSLRPIAVRQLLRLVLKFKSTKNEIYEIEINRLLHHERNRNRNG